MPYKLHKEEALGEGLKRVADEQISGAIDDLEERNIYEVRRRIKKLRAILRLLKPDLGPLYPEENRRLRDVGRRFSSMRDLDVSLELLDKYSANYKRKNTFRSHRTALAAKRAALDHQHQDLSEPAAILLATRKRIENWPLERLTRQALDERFKHTGKRSRKAFHHAKKTRSAEDFHELRKSVKHELNQLKLLNEDDPQMQPLKELSTLLGDHHNLVVLMANLENASERFRGDTQRHMREYEAKILAVAGTLYDHRPAPHAAVA